MSLWEWLKNLFSKIPAPKSLVTIGKTVILPETRNMKVLKMAASQIGVKEVKGRGSNAVVEEYLAYGFRSNKSGLKDDVPWCAGFVAWCLEKVGMGSTNSLMARSYEKWGLSVKDKPLPGDIIVFYRNSLSSGQGHVGFYVASHGSSRAYVLGGNQSDSVNVTSYSKVKMRDIRRSSKAGEYTRAQRLELKKLADQILAGNKIQPPGSVV